MTFKQLTATIPAAPSRVSRLVKQMRHSEWAYVVMGLAIAGACFTVILTRNEPVPEAWLTIGAIVGHWFGRHQNGGK